MEERIGQKSLPRRECRRWVSQIVEYACQTAEPNEELRNHLSACATCTARWEQQRSLTLAYDRAREAARNRMSPNLRREELMQAFAAAHRPRYSLVRNWLAAAAALLLAVALGYVLLDRESASTGKGRAVTAQVTSSADPIAVDASSDEDDFVPVPDAPPLAAGEFVSVVRTEMQAPALARMGIYVDASYGPEVPAEVMVGEDGLPRAVRVIGAIEF